MLMLMVLRGCSASWEALLPLNLDPGGLMDEGPFDGMHAALPRLLPSRAFVFYNIECL